MQINLPHISQRAMRSSNHLSSSCQDVQNLPSNTGCRSGKMFLHQLGKNPKIERHAARWLSLQNFDDLEPTTTSLL